MSDQPPTEKPRGSDQAPDMRFGLLWGEAHSAVAGYIQSLVGDRTTTDDLVQEVALAAFRSFGTFDQSRPFTAWALGVARHRVHQHWRTLSRQRPLFQDVTLLEELATISAELDDTLSEEKRALRDCLASVEGRSWELVRLHYIDGMAAEDIGERLKLASGHVRVLLHRVRSALRTCIERRLATDGGHG
jgi:RNA polymerase sigma-70 factor, ECF subfamily